MNRIAAGLYAATGFCWGATGLFVPQWWQSPAFGRSVLPLWVSSVLWLYAAMLLAAMWSQVPVRPAVAVSALVSYALPTSLIAASIFTFTVEANAVSAVGSAIAWAGLASSAWARTAAVIRISDVGNEHHDA